MPFVTVIMSAYQAAATLKRAVASVKAQVFQDWELIVVNDGSTDATGRLAEEYAQSDERIRIINLERNAGPAAARNRAWRESRSPLLAVLDADDVALPDRLSTQVEYLSQHKKVSVLGSGAYFADSKGVYLRTVTLPSTHAELIRRRWHVSPFIHSTTVLRREFLDATGGYLERPCVHEDYDLWMRGLQHCDVVYHNLPMPLVIYCTPRVQRWAVIRASALVRIRTGRRERRLARGLLAASRVIAEGILEQTGLFAWLNRGQPGRSIPTPLRAFGESQR
jgi:glycosyltransferase involved in cell wall biosynthesis